VPINQKILKIMGGIFGWQIDCFRSIIIIEKMKASNFALTMYILPEGAMINVLKIFDIFGGNNNLTIGIFFFD